MSASDPLPTPRTYEATLFVAWDTTSPGLDSTLELVHGELVANRRGVVPGLKRSQGFIPEDKVLGPMRASDAVLAFLDLPNANVGFELGYALGLGKPVWLACHGSRRPTWIEFAPLAGYIVPSVFSATTVEELLRSTAPLPPLGPPDDGERVLFICPTGAHGVHDNFRHFAKKMPDHWVCFDPEKSKLDDLPKLLSGFGTVVWAYFPPAAAADRDGVENARLSIVAGYAAGAGLSFHFLHFGKPTDARKLADLADRRDFFETRATFESLLKDIDAKRSERKYVKKRDAYLSSIADRFQWFRPLGFEGRYRVELRLDELTVEPQCAFGDARGGGRSLRDASDAAEAIGDGRGGERVRMLAAFDPAPMKGRRGVVLLGDPGSGKTTQLRRVVRWLTTSGDGGDAPHGPLTGFVPFFIPLRELDQDRIEEETTPAALIAHAMKAACVPADEHAVQDLLRRERILFVVDGLDEVADEKKRDAVAKRLDALVDAAAREIRVLVSCRFAGFPKDARLFSAERFVETHLLPLNGELAETFVRSWYAAVEAAGSPSGLMKDRAAQAAAEAEKLNDLIRSQNTVAKRIRDMTGNPLLLTAICLVHRDKKELPKGRAELYGLCVRVLLDFWWKEHFGDQSAGLVMERAQSERVLMEMAWWMHSVENRTSATDAELVEPLKAALAAAGRPESPEQFLRAIRDDSGLLTGWGSDYRFMHLGLQEYLVARDIQRVALDESERIVELAKNFASSWWQEPAALLLALEGTSCFSTFFKELVKTPAFGDVAERQKFLALIDDAREPKSKVFEDFAKRPPGNDRSLWLRQRTACLLTRKISESAWSALRAHFESKPHPFDEIQNDFGLPPSRTAPSLPAEPRATLPDPRETPPGVQVLKTKNGGVELVRVPAGRFWMGARDDETEALPTERPRHLGTISRDFYLGRYAVTNAEFAAFMEAVKGDPAYKFKEPDLWRDKKFNGERQPVVGVDYDTARLFCRWAGADGAAGFVGELPTEAQWEYACRAGTEGRYWSETAKDKDPKAALARVGWFDENSEGRLHVVGEKPPNPFGLYDMHGNVWEWCRDYFNFYAPAEVADPDFQDEARGKADTTSRRRDKGIAVKPDDEWAARVIRGGSWGYVASWCRSAARVLVPPGDRWNVLGFRLALSAPRAQ